MTAFKLKGSDLYDNSSNHKVATLKGNDLYNDKNHKIAVIKGQEIFDERNHKVATVKGSDVYDDHNHKVISLNDIKKSIDTSTSGPSVVACWLFFAR